MPRSVKDETGSHETIHVDGQTFRRRMPRIRTDYSADEIEELRKKPKDAEAVGFVEVFTRGPAPTTRSCGWSTSTRRGSGPRSSTRRSASGRRRSMTRAGARAGARCSTTGRSSSSALAALRVRGDDPAARRRRRRRRGHRAAGPGVHARVLLGRAAVRCRPYHHDVWEPLWAAPRRPAWCSASTSAPSRTTPRQSTGVYFRGPGGAVLNYVETTYGGQRARQARRVAARSTVTPTSRCWCRRAARPGARSSPTGWTRPTASTASSVRPKLDTLPKRVPLRQVYASFQHDGRRSRRSARWVAAT